MKMKFFRFLFVLMSNIYDILMRKWRPPDVSAEDEWTVNHQIVVPKAYHPEILNLAHETPMSGHLGINKTTTKFSSISSGQD